MLYGMPSYKNDLDLIYLHVCGLQTGDLGSKITAAVHSIVCLYRADLVLSPSRDTRGQCKGSTLYLHFGFNLLPTTTSKHLEGAYLKQRINKALLGL